mmetsp:Transcript_47761/g.153109  ORF Transcript_47761/g.153109 Transcript_47761/m.153109 type:complete len:83 (+) Transcript_47761:497-745(+)
MPAGGAIMLSEPPGPEFREPPPDVRAEVPPDAPPETEPDGPGPDARRCCCCCGAPADHEGDDAASESVPPLPLLPGTVPSPM